MSFWQGGELAGACRVHVRHAKAMLRHAFCSLAEILQSSACFLLWQGVLLDPAARILLSNIRAIMQWLIRHFIEGMYGSLATYFQQQYLFLAERKAGRCSQSSGMQRHWSVMRFNIRHQHCSLLLAFLLWQGSIADGYNVGCNTEAAEQHQDIHAKLD